MGCPAALCREELPHGRVQLVAHDFLVEDVDAFEDRLVELSPGLVAGVAVELVGLLKQRDMGLDVSGPRRDVIGDRGEAGFELSSLVGEFSESSTDASRVHLTVGGEIKEVLFLGPQPCELAFSLLAQQAPCSGLIIDRGFQVGPDGENEVCVEGDGLVVLGDDIFNPVDVGVRRVTGVVLNAAAEEVRVGRSLLRGDVHEDHASVDLVFETAASAPDRAFQVVGVLAAALVGVAARAQQDLHLLEQWVADEWFVSPGEGLALVADFAEVVPIAQELVDLRVRDGSGWSPRGGPSDESAVGELVCDVLEGEVSGRVELEGELHERCSFGVDGDGVDLAPVDVVGDVEVADWCAAERPAVLSLLPHLVRDVRTVLPGAVLVEGSEDAVHELPDRSGVDLLSGGDEGDAAFLQVGHDDGIVDAVAGEAGQLVDDDVVDVAVAADAFEHLLEGDALGHLGSGLSGFDVLANDGEAELFSFAGAGLALGGDGEAFRVVVGVDLTLG